jgi:hypothetical protein
MQYVGSVNDVEASYHHPTIGIMMTSTFVRLCMNTWEMRVGPERENANLHKALFRAGLEACFPALKFNVDQAKINQRWASLVEQLVEGGFELPPAADFPTVGVALRNNRP